MCMTLHVPSMIAKGVKHDTCSYVHTLICKCTCNHSKYVHVHHVHVNNYNYIVCTRYYYY